MNRYSILVTLISFFCALSWCQTEQELHQLVERLGHDDYKVREYAKEQLLRAGKRSIPALKKALDSKDAEISWRARILLEDIQDSQKEGKDAKKEEIEAFKPLPEPSKNQKSSTGMLSIIQNGNVFKVKIQNDGSFEIHTEKVLADGKKVSNDFTYATEEEFKQKNPGLYNRYKKMSSGFSFKELFPHSNGTPSKPFSFRFKFDKEPFEFQFPKNHEFDTMEKEIQKLLERSGRQKWWLDHLDMENKQLKDFIEQQRNLLRQFGNLNQDRFLENLDEERIKERMQEAQKQFDKAQKKLNEIRGRKKSYFGLKIVPLNEALKSQIGREGVMIELVDGNAKKAGFQKYDIILSINDVPTPNPEALVKVFNELKKGSKVKAIIVRKLATKEIVFTY